MKMTQSGDNFARYELGELTVVALRDGHVDMPPSRLRQEGDRPFGADLPGQVSLVDGQLRLSVNAFLVIEQDRRRDVAWKRRRKWHRLTAGQSRPRPARGAANDIRPGRRNGHPDRTKELDGRQMQA